MHHDDVVVGEERWRVGGGLVDVAPEHLDSDCRRLRDEARQKHGGAGGEHGDSHGPARRGPVGVHLRLGAVEGRQHVVGPADEGSTGVGEPKPASVRLEKCHPGFPLQDFELLRHC